MGKPYSDLDKRAFAILSNGGNPATSQDKELAKYWAWKLDPSATSHDLDAASVRTTGRKLNYIGINPFGIDMAANNYAKVTVTKRTDAILTDVLENILKHEKDPTGKVFYPLKGFKPAKVYFRRGAATSPRPETSRITGRKYKTYYQKGDLGYSAPFGQGVESDTFLSKSAQIRGAIQTAFADASLITFSPEKVRGS
ncbi:hypothetical protein [Pleurocapsa sp. FMAR1]|uniref:hypothetical protein n=1 Tax=Pleurocapsa sp. FMAR1 TaxID=3040204 RepID=UPI0029C71A4E|nr:hypothetical protein [Pleurocapsa sp. FMAR1]